MLTMNSSRPKRCSKFVILSGLALMCGCSSFDRDWKAAATVKPESPTDMTGRWQGIWASDASSHNGGLRCLITRTGDDTYHARYAATYWSIFHFGYDMDLTAQQQADAVHFQGQADLGSMAGGVYHYDGHANATDFTSTYQSESDHGKFVMKRPEGNPNSESPKPE
ncbi:MAG TPA: hypothetical protein VG269_25755 [Tepidisphaeraceae bacterium]|jgi:hypothetical protein|nr:hypothetical protein [Tepidisphaeraceae bacterium]